MKTLHLHRLCRLLAFASFLTILSGCAGGEGASLPTGPAVPTGPVQGTSFEGRVEGSGQPVAGASVQLYEAGTAGNGSASSALLSAAVVTDAAGSFTIPSTFSCPATDTFLFLTAKEGHIGASGPDNPALVFLTPIGACGDVTTKTPVTLNELTTVASAFAFAPFLSTGGNLGASATNGIGLSNALATARTLANLGDGQLPAANIPSNASVETGKLGTLANVIASCVAAPTSCTALFAAATPAGASAPSNTLDAIYDIVRHPTNNVAGIYGLSSGSVYPSSLVAAPSDWTLTITLTGGGLNGPKSVAVDASGTVWVVNYNGALSAFAPGGAPVFLNGITGSGLNESDGLAIDGQNDVWTTSNETPGINNNLGVVSEFTNDGQPLSGASGYVPGGIYYPIALAADTNETMWVANYGNSTVMQLTSSGGAAAGLCTPNGCGFSSASIALPDAIAVDANHYAWVASQFTDTVTKISPDGTQMTPIDCCSGAAGLAIDANGNLWSANYYGDSVSLVTNAGSVLSHGFTGGGLVHPQSIAVDGAGTAWTANFLGNSITELAGAGSATPGTPFSPPAGFGVDAAMVQPYGIAIDASGNVWVSNYGTLPAPGQQGTLTQFVGLAAPVKTPLVGPVKTP